MNIDNIASKESPYERALEKPSCNESNVGEKETPPRKDNPEQTANNNTNRPADLPNEESEEDDLEGISEEAKRIAQKATDFFKKQEEFKQRNKKRG